MKLLLDSNNLVHANWFTVGDGAAQLSLDKLLEFRDRVGCELVCCFDSGECFRHDLFPEYKAGRESGKADEQLKEFRVLLEGEGIRCLSMVGFEADDLIAHSVDGKCVVWSGDGDLYQLLSDEVVILKQFNGSPGGRKPVWFNQAALVEKFGVSPGQWVDFRCMVGDKSDGIKGADGVGKKTAAMLLRRYGDMERVLKEVDWLVGVNKRQIAGLKSIRGKIGLLRKLHTLRRDCFDG